jgi:hypothetical protein
MKGMKFVIPWSAVLLLGGAPPSEADEIAHATVRVFVYVQPNIAVIPTVPTVDLGSVQTGLISGQVPFRVESNSQNIRFSAAATHLFKGGTATGTSALGVEPIQLGRGAGIRFDAAQASPVHGANDVLHYVGPETEVAGLLGLVTRSMEFESSQNNRFSQEVNLEVTWNQNDPEKPTGEYSGSVVLWAMVPPSGFPSGSPQARAGRR